MWWTHKWASGLVYIAREGDEHAEKCGDKPAEVPAVTDAAIAERACGDKPAVKIVQAPPCLFPWRPFHVFVTYFVLLVPFPTTPSMTTKNALQIVLPF